MKIKTIRQIRKCMNGNLAAYLSPLVRWSNQWLRYCIAVLCFSLFFQSHRTGNLHCRATQPINQHQHVISKENPLRRTLWWEDQARQTEQVGRVDDYYWLLLMIIFDYYWLLLIVRSRWGGRWREERYPLSVIIINTISILIAGGPGGGGKRDTQGGTSFPAFDPTSKGSQISCYPNRQPRSFCSTRQKSKTFFLFFGDQHLKVWPNIRMFLINI